MDRGENRYAGREQPGTPARHAVCSLDLLCPEMRHDLERVVQLDSAKDRPDELLKRACGSARGEGNPSLRWRDVGQQLV